MLNLAPSASSIAIQLASRFADYRTHLNEIALQLRQFKMLADACPIAMFMADSAGRVVYVNKPFLKMAGAELNEIQIEGWKKFILPEAVEQVTDDWETAVRNSDTYQNTVDWVRPDGEITRFSVEATRIPDDGWVGFCTPVPELNGASGRTPTCIP